MQSDSTRGPIHYALALDPDDFEAVRVALKAKSLGRAIDIYRPPEHQNGLDQ